MAGKRKLTYDQVMAIRSSQDSVSELATQYAVNRLTIMAAKNGTHAYKNVTEDPPWDTTSVGIFPLSNS